MASIATGENAEDVDIDSLGNIESENQTCSGNILTKLQCIKSPVQDNISMYDNRESPETQVQDNVDLTVSQNPDVESTLTENHFDTRSCSGNILTTLQCIKMPAVDDDLSSINSSSHSIKSVMEDQSLSSSLAVEVEAHPCVNKHTDQEQKCNDNINATRSSSIDSVQSAGNVTVENSKQPNESNASNENGNSVSDTDSDNVENNDNTEQESMANYVRRVIENDPNLPRHDLIAILDRLWDTDDDDDGNDAPFDISIGEQPNLPQLYPMGQLVFADCEVCFERKDINLRACCDKPVCDDCILYFVTLQVQQAIVKIKCPISECDQYIHRDEIMTRLSGDMKEKFYKFLVDANKDPHIKTCPRCSTVMTIEPSILKDPKIKKKGLCVNCGECSLEWCFCCQAPWHKNIKCKQFREGDALFKRWTKDQTLGQPNARKCPRCKIFIQRSTGCDHMRCVKCDTDFCYQCGERFRSFKFIGDHYSRLSIFGCKYRLYPNSPVRRRLVRGSIFGAKLLVTPVLAALLVGAGAVILAGGIFILPVWIGLRVKNHLRDKEARKQARMYREHWEERRQQIRKTADPYLENFTRMQSLGINPYNGRSSMRKGTGNVLFVDELDMRGGVVAPPGAESMFEKRSSSASLSDSSVLTTATSSVPPQQQRIQLSPNSLDIHASLDSYPVQHVYVNMARVQENKSESVNGSGETEIEEPEAQINTGARLPDTRAKAGNLIERCKELRKQRNANKGVNNIKSGEKSDEQPSEFQADSKKVHVPMRYSDINTKCSSNVVIENTDKLSLDSNPNSDTSSLSLQRETDFKCDAYV